MISFFYHCLTAQSIQNDKLSVPRKMLKITKSYQILELKASIVDEGTWR
jgi:hypothetical protein